MGIKIKKKYHPDIVEKYQSGLSSVDISKTYGVSYSTIIDILKKCNIKIGGHNRKIFKTEHEKIIQQYVDGEKISNIAKSYGVVRETIAKILRDNAINLRKVGRDNRKYDINDEYFDNIDSETKAYFLGLLFADGHNDEKYYVSIGLQRRDSYVLDKLIEELYGVRKPSLIYDYRKSKNNNKKDIARCIICSSHICKSLKIIGMVNNKSLVLKPPFFLNDLLFKHFLRGYFDGDGSVYENKPRCRISTSGKESYSKYSLSFSLSGTYEFLIWIKSVIENRYGSKIKTNINKAGNIFQWTVGKQSDVEFIYNFMYSNSFIFLCRKKEIFKKYFGEAVTIHP